MGGSLTLSRCSEMGDDDTVLISGPGRLFTALLIAKHEALVRMAGLGSSHLNG